MQLPGSLWTRRHTLKLTVGDSSPKPPSLNPSSDRAYSGTGTAIGDPSELSALGATFGKTRTPENPIYAASVKTNIGHLEGCAGLAGVIKTILAVERGEIPPLADFEKANPRLKLDEWRVALPERLTPWPTQGLRRASVNSFGYGMFDPESMRLCH